MFVPFFVCFEWRAGMSGRVILAVAIFLALHFSIGRENAFGGPIYGPSPSGTVPGGEVPEGDANPPNVPSGLVPSLNGPGFNLPSNGSSSTSGNNGQNGSQPNNPSNPMNPNSLPGGSNGQGQPASSAPTFMNNAMPNVSNPFLPNNISPGLLSSPLENAYMQNGVPQLAAPMMSAVYRPFGLTFFQPDPFQVAPQGSVTLTGMYGEASNVDFSTNQPSWGSFFSITPAVYYSNFDDYGYISLMGSASYYQYNSGSISAYLNETGGISAGTYLGDRVFVGVQDMGFTGFSPGMNGSPLAFFTGIKPYYGNMSDAEVGFALTPKITFVQSASDMYFDDSGFGAGVFNVQSLMDTLNYKDAVNFLSLSYTYQQGIISMFPGFISNGVMGSAMRMISPLTSFGFGGTISDFLYNQSSVPTSFFGSSSNSLNFYMYSYYGILTHQLTRSLSISLQGGLNTVSFYNGETFQAPMIDMNIAYTGPRLGLGLNAGEYMENMTSYGVELGPEKTKDIMGYLTYRIGSKTSLFSSAGYSIYTFLSPYNFSNNFFQTLQPNTSYSGSYLDLSAGINYTPEPWVNTSLDYNMVDFSSGIPNTAIIENMFMAMVTFVWSFK